jgi:hypothetical protein
MENASWPFDFQLRHLMQSAHLFQRHLMVNALLLPDFPIDVCCLQTLQRATLLVLVLEVAEESDEGPSCEAEIIFAVFVLFFVLAVRVADA